MRVHTAIIATALAFVSMAFASTAFAQDGLFQRDHGNVPAPVGLERPLAAAPPEGAGPGGLDFGMWRGTNPAAYGESMQTRLRARSAGKALAVVRADLEANGFACVDAASRTAGRAPALECRLAVEDRNCAVEWWAVLEDPAAAILAGFDRMCLPAGRR